MAQPASELPPYTGEVTVGGQAAVRVMGDLRMTKLAVGPYDNNAYLLQCRRTGDGLLIDAAAEPDRLLTLGRITRILTTHGHYDHWGALSEVAGESGAATAMHPADAIGISTPVDVPVHDGDEFQIGAVTLHAIHLVGHTLGSIALAHADSDGTHHIWTGDCLFPGGIGRTYHDPAAFTLLFDGVVRQVFGAYPDDTSIYPGHGNDTTLGAERPQLAEWERRQW